jgi:predicted AAA+ superfamily ATPase
MNYVFLDEVQVVSEFEKAAGALYGRDDVDLYITGSNAFLLSGELTTLLTGRFIEIPVHPYSFAEYCSSLENAQTYGYSYPTTHPKAYAPNPPEKEAVFNRYLTYGGLPYAATLNEGGTVNQDLEGVFNTILMRDIATRKPQMDMRAFKATASFLADNIGNISSLRKISDTLSVQGNSVSRNSVASYIESLISSFLLYKVNRYDLKGKAYLRSDEKYYVGDMGFRYWLLGKEAGDVGRRIENIVYLELLRRYSRIDIGKQGIAEVDFVARKEGTTHYYQVAQTVLADETLSRELLPLQNIKDSFPKTLLTLDRIGTGNMDGINHINLIDWLLADNSE